jgi:hypothetical protein
MHPDRERSPSNSWLTVFLIVINLARDVNQGTMAIHTFILIAGPGVDYGFMRQHGPAFVRYIEQVSMALHTLLVFKRSIGGFAVFSSIVFFQNEVDKKIFYAMKGFLVEKIKGILGGRQMAVHAIGDKALTVIDMG